MRRFSEDQTCKFVKLYRHYGLLWNPKHQHYKNHRMKQIACENMARLMNIEGFTWRDVRAKVKTLRGTYNLEKQKIKKLADQGYESALKWMPLMASFIERIGDPQAPSDDLTSEKDVYTPDEILEDSQWENSGSISDKGTVEITSVLSETELEQSVRSIDSEVVTVTPEIHTLQSVANSTAFTVTPEIITVKSISSPTVVSGIQTVPSASSPKLFALIPEDHPSNSDTNHTYIAISPGSKKAKCVGGSQVFKPKTKQVPTDRTHKRRHDEVSSTNSSNDNCQVRQVKLIGEDFSNANEDEMDAFGHFVALNLRKLPMQSSFSAQAEILSVLTRHRLNRPVANLPQKKIVPYILTNNNSPTENSTLQKVCTKS